jgi:RimJ/RimL family protein N-acetyltransferase
MKKSAQRGTPVIFLRSKKVILRPINRETDLPKLIKWINDPEIRRFLLPYLPVSHEMEQEWLDSLEKSAANQIVLAIETLDGNFIGTMGIHHINWKDRTAVTGTLIGEKKYRSTKRRRKGYGTDAKMAVLDYIFNTLNLRKVCSSVIVFNERSLHYSLKCGYKIEGRRRKQIFKDGEYYDEIMLGVFKEEWLAARKEWEKKLRPQRRRP